MTLGEANIKALKILNQYSINSTVVADDYNGTGDLKRRMSCFADMAQKEISRTVAKIEKTIKVSHTEYKNLLTSDHKIHTVLSASFTPSSGAGSFYIEIDNICTLTVKTGGLDKTYTITPDPDGFTAVQDTFDDQITSMVINSDYPCNYRNAAMYAEKFRTADDVPPYHEYFTVDTPPDLWQYRPRGIKFIGDYSLITEQPDYFTEDGNLFLLSRTGEWKIGYYAKPQEITSDTPDTYEFEIPYGEDVIPIKMASLCALDIGNIDATVLTALNNEYAKAMNMLAPEPVYTTRTIRNVYD